LRVFGSQAVKIFDRVVARIGLRPHEAHDHGYPPSTNGLP
jgi:hypothetical protein